MPIQSGEDMDFGGVLRKAYRGSAEALGVTTENSLVKHKYDSIKKTDTAANIETYDYYVGLIATGTIVTTIVVTYTDATKTNLVSVEKTFEADLG